jgi:hypothetical protein
MPQTIKLYEAIKRMRVLTELGIPFTFTFLSYNSTEDSSAGFKDVTNAQLRKGYRDDQSNKSQMLIGYVNEHDCNRWFYLPLLMKFNGIQVKP